MNRRSFIVKTSVVGATLPFAGLLEGCTASQVIGEVNVVLTEATNILIVADPNASWVKEMQTAITALKTSEASWQAGGTIQEVDDALNTVVAVTAVIPLTVKYSPLVDVLVAGIEVILGTLPAATTGLSAHTATAVATNPHVGRVTISHKFMHSHVTEFKDAWNAAAKDNGLVGATI